MQLALDACRRVLLPNFSAIALQFPPVNRHTLRRRFYGLQDSQPSANSMFRQNLTSDQEEELIKVINDLSFRGLPPTSSMVRNLAEEMVSRPVGKNWTGQFIKRHKDRLKSIYLRNMDNMRVKAEYGPMIQLFFRMVCILIALYSYFC